MAVKTPTNDVIPTAIIRIVNIDLNLLLAIDFNATLKFSLKSGERPIFLYVFFTAIYSFNKIICKNRKLSLINITLHANS